MAKSTKIYLLFLPFLIFMLTASISASHASSPSADIDNDQILSNVSSRLQDKKTLQDNPHLADARKQEPLEDRIFVRGQSLTYDVPPFIENGRTLIPVRTISEELGAEIYFSEEDSKVTIERNDKEIELELDSQVASVNDESVVLDSSPRVEDGRIFVPLRFIGKTLGDSVTYLEETGEIDIGLNEYKDKAENNISNDQNKDITSVREDIGRKLTSEVLTDEDISEFYRQAVDIGDDISKARQTRDELGELIDKRRAQLGLGDLDDVDDIDDLDELDDEGLDDELNDEDDIDDTDEDTDDSDVEEEEETEDDAPFYEVESWEEEDYEDHNIDNFKENDLFQERIDLENIDYPRLNAAIFYHTNFARDNEGLESLDYNKNLEVASFNHSVKMEENNFVDHTNMYDGTRRNPNDRAELAGIQNPMIAENIAKTPVQKILDDDEIESGGGTMEIEVEITELEEADKHTYNSFAKEVVRGWMHSEGHRANILHEEALELGAGTYLSDGDIPSILSTQKFQLHDEVTEDDEGYEDELDPYEK
ncbi:stalk domain-containing protein [Natranaerofaba carboxydovora]|uniref:stalk domain-containing protein n=1 Tax=Natranaerofaba carboxydovora TaxID=2742683 RepID=UPI001F13DFD9|nr:stalk domain-containing protein [Natranaerofaba carboxydovora]UMZ74900.1 hypothetical protein ACONDI_02504 [Natranaerofaba carboxydovora]